MDMQELEKLHSLLKKGIITEEQFNQKKKQILNNNQSDSKSDKKNTIDYKIDTNAIKSYSIMTIIMLLSIICSISVMMCCITTVSTIVKPYNELSGWEYVSVALALTIGIFFIIKKLIAKLLNLRSDTKFIKFYRVFAYILIVISVIIVSIIIYNNVSKIINGNKIQKEYYDNGQLKTETPYKNGMENGVVKKYYENGKLKSEEEYINGHSNGIVKVFWENGNLKIEGKKSSRAGIITYSNGQLITDEQKELKEVYESWKEYYDNGELKSESDGEVYKTYYPNGKIQSETPVSEYGTTKEYYSNGNLKYAMEYKILSQSGSYTRASRTTYIECKENGDLKYFSKEYFAGKSESEIEKLCRGANESNSASTGEQNSTIELIEYFDFSCPFSKEYAQKLTSYVRNNKNVDIIFKPLAFVGEYSEYLAKIFLAVSKQNPDKVLDTYEAIMKLENINETEIDNILNDMNLNPQEIKRIALSKEIENKLSEINQIAQSNNVEGVPTFIVDGEKKDFKYMEKLMK